MTLPDQETTMTTEDAHWTRRAACRGTDPERFADVDREKWPPPESVEAARHFCAGCPVRAACDAYAERLGAVGVWAGKYRHSLEGYLVEVTDLLDPALAPRFDTPPEVRGRRLKVWEAMPPAGFTTPGRIAEASGVDHRDVSVELGWLAARELAVSPKRGVWRRAAPAVEGAREAQVAS